ncbi:MAG: response regulator [Deltaproteobacteria bacterium]|nr:response regulator [Deltaproteobacteria bacterium]
MNKILIVDDDLAIRILYAEELIEEGYEVVTYDGGKDLLNVINEETPDLVLLDIRLGEESGLDILQDIRNTYYNLPVILCTAYQDFKYDLKSIAADYYVLKSSDMKDLKLKVKMAFQGMERLESPGASGQDIGGENKPCLTNRRFNESITITHSF